MPVFATRQRVFATTLKGVEVEDLLEVDMLKSIGFMKLGNCQ